MIDGDFFSEIVELRTARCKQIHQLGIYYTPLRNVMQTEYQLKINQTILVFYTSGKSLNRYGNCVSTTFTNLRGTWHKVVVHAKYSIVCSK